MHGANTAITPKSYVIPKLEDILTELHLREGYHQILLHPDSITVLMIFLIL